MYVSFNFKQDDELKISKPINQIGHCKEDKLDMSLLCFYIEEFNKA